MRNGRGDIQACLGIENVSRICRIAKDEGEIIHVARTYILPLGVAQAITKHNLDPVVFQERGKAAMVPGDVLCIGLKLIASKRFKLTVG